MNLSDFLTSTLSNIKELHIVEPTVIAILIVGLVIVFIQIYPIYRKAFKFILYKDDSFENNNLNSKVKEIQYQIDSIEEKLTKNILKNKDNLIHATLEKYIENNLTKIIEKNINDPKKLKSIILDNLKSDIEKNTTKYLDNTSLEKIQNSILVHENMKRKNESYSSLESTLNKESNSASMLKTVMINLFVIATFAFIGFNIFKGTEVNSSTYIPILGLYFSLGAFMLYIIRTSHFRTSVLLAIKEDERNYYNFEEYTSKFKSKGEFTEHDVDILRMIMTNRSEREQKANHPYEVILKNISGSSIQFQGGKIAVGSQKETSS